MIKTPLNKSIRKQTMSVVRNSIDHERNEGMLDMPAAIKPRKMSVNEKVERLYKKQIPVIAGGAPNMEIESEAQRDADSLQMGGAKLTKAKKGGVLLSTGVKINKAPLAVVPERMTQVPLSKPVGGSLRKAKQVEGAELVGGSFNAPIQQQNNLPFPSGGAKKPRAKKEPVLKGPMTPHQMQPKPKGASVRAAIVKKVMNERGMSLPQASKYVKDHNLY
jgi:hypothetical protein